MFIFFKDLRENTLRTNKLFGYLLYAIGEIILVVIGILIAIQLDNLNEARKNVEDFKVALHEVEKDLIKDISQTDQLIDWCEFYDSLSTLILNNQATSEMYTNSRLPYLLTRVAELRIRQNGYNAIQKVFEFAPPKYDTLTKLLTQLYAEKSPSVVEFGKEIKELSRNTLTLWRERFEWFSAKGPTNPLMIKYFLTDWNYKNRVKYRQLIASIGRCQIQ